MSRRVSSKRRTKNSDALAIALFLVYVFKFVYSAVSVVFVAGVTALVVSPRTRDVLVSHLGGLILPLVRLIEKGVKYLLRMTLRQMVKLFLFVCKSAVIEMVRTSSSLFEFTVTVTIGTISILYGTVTAVARKIAGA